MYSLWDITTAVSEVIISTMHKQSFSIIFMAVLFLVNEYSFAGKLALPFLLKILIGANFNQFNDKTDMTHIGLVYLLLAVSPHG